MAYRHWLVGLVWLLLLAGLVRAGGGDPPPATAGMPRIPLESLPFAIREGIQAVLDNPTLASKGIPETFNADPAMYHWLLGHADVVAKLWRLLGAKVSDINEHEGLYSWQDGHGSDVHWYIAYRGKGIHAWYAEGKAKPTLLLPASPFRALAVLQYTEGKDPAGKPAIRHQVHFLLRCDGRAMALAARILGASAPHLAEQYLGHLQMFYGGLAWYLWQDDDRARRMFHQVGVKVEEPAER
jgi:hypothetical protein